MNCSGIAESDRQMQGAREVVAHVARECTLAADEDARDGRVLLQRVVVVDRAADLVGERLAGGVEDLVDLAHRGRLEIGRRGGAAAEADGEAQEVGLLMSEAAVLHDGLDQRLVAEVHDARELRRAAGRDDDVADAGADVDERARPVGLRRALVDERDRRRDGAHERERLKVDAVDGEAGLARHLHELVDHVALCGDDEDLLAAAALTLARGRREHLEVQDRLVERDGDGLPAPGTRWRRGAPWDR